MFTWITPLILAAFALTIWAQFKVKGNFNKFSQVPAQSGMSGAEVARRILDDNGLHHVPVEPVPGTLTDHFDPMSNAVRLSEPVYYGNSISSISVAAHEVGHAIQHKEGYSMLVLRHRMFPAVNLTSGIAPFLLLAGVFFKMTNLLLIGIIFFSVAVAFQLITLPVEFNASSRAKRLMLAEGFVARDEKRGVDKVLGAAALTYVASTLVAVMQLLEYIWIFTSNKED
ncbi:zinc metallopeptidase [Aneurinibacillus aneurinilyticus]|jgi:Zn-dependent membrane protease YugP|uniref:Zinc metallopeptidase n=2 Tax=Aneurinibacillus aneurinilyticus TaxID=1391 RepID=A0A848CNZ4_ANEAE|nr:zinc metallopeptidase [Aneurinibacillus aneurinilyticus]ERI05899.1 putative neutral zinc metallopeptidase [Aneurinibacillus aneurinilyticus ATCC 12856]MCI1692655.1 zinc metallopeptidase [Aneurinibacillus aneurinilyticus]MED0672756.1 zinc metallopeptidase [Aneurinibacillus aneurinilyticus]MED0708583.1 zinc metallopeptidase [Aneurinibacillus aneurinilyticus]MED0721743.1 zinc metallopeptidase [Aneurinibacillus aneurinilyticus]